MSIREKMEKSLLELIVDLINALARPSVPLVVIIFIYKFRNELSDILKRLKKGKILGQEIEVSERIDELSENAAEEYIELPPSVITEEQTIKEEERIKVTEESRVILEEAEKNPKKALDSVVNRVEMELKDLIATHGLIRYFEKGFHFLKASALLQNRGVVSRTIGTSLRNFYKLKKDITEKQTQSSGEDILRLTDLGIILSNSIKAIPRESYEVLAPNIEVFKDNRCRFTKSENIKLQTSCKHNIHCPDLWQCLTC